MNEYMNYRLSLRKIDRSVPHAKTARPDRRPERKTGG